MIQLTIQSLEGIQYQGQIKQATIPTPQGEITILPGHQNLVSICTSGIMKIIPTQITPTLANKYIISKDIVHLTISQGIIQLEDNVITILTSQASTQKQSLQILEENRQSLMKQLQEIQTSQNSDNYEDILSDLQKIEADIRLSKLG